MATESDLRAIALALPGAYEHASYGGAPSFRTKPRAFAFVREDLDAVAVHIASEEDKWSLIASDDTVYFTTPHYDGYAVVLVRLAAIGVDELTELITDAWRLRAPKRDVNAWDAE